MSVMASRTRDGLSERRRARRRKSNIDTDEQVTVAEEDLVVASSTAARRSSPPAASRKSAARSSAAAADEEDDRDGTSPPDAGRRLSIGVSSFAVDDDDDDDPVPSVVSRRWKAALQSERPPILLAADDIEETKRADNGHKRKKKEMRAHHSGSYASSHDDESASSAVHSRSHSRSTSSVSHAATATAHAASPLPSPMSAKTRGVEYTALPYAARLEYEAAYTRRWKPPMALLCTTLLERYVLKPKSTTPRAQHSMSVVDTRHVSTLTLSEYFDADLALSPGVASPPSSMITHPAPRHFRSASASLSTSASSAAQHDRDEAERHSLAKGKLKIQAALLRRKQLDWQRRVDAGETTWEQLEEAEAAAERRKHEKHQERHRTAVSRILDPRDHNGQRRLDDAASAARLATELQQSVEWYWNNIPIGAVAIMRVIVHNHAFDACLPPAPQSTPVGTPATGQDDRQRRSRSADLRGQTENTTDTHKYQLCRTWMLSDLLYSLRGLLISVMQSERESTAAPARSAHHANGAAAATAQQQTADQTQARLVWLLNNIVVLLHLTKSLALQYHRGASADPTRSPHRYVPRFVSSPETWSTRLPIDFPNAYADGSSEHDPLAKLSSDVGAYLFEIDFDATSDNALHWFYRWLMRLARAAAECLLQHIFTRTPLHTLTPAILLQPSELMCLGGESLDALVDVLDTVFESMTQAGLLNLLKSQLMQAMMEQIMRGLMHVVLSESLEAPVPSSSVAASPSSSSSSSGRLLSQSVPLGMKLSMIYSSLEDWSQRCTAFSHPFVHATRLTLAPLKEACLFCLIDEKRELESLDEFTVLAPSMPRTMLLALCQAYNALPGNEDQVATRVIRQIRKESEKEQRAESLRATQEEQEGRDTNSPSVPSPVSTARAASTTDTSLPPLPPFFLSLDLSSQLGKFILSSVDLPAHLTDAHPAFAFLKNQDETLVL